jgi:hypothetical protein
MSRLKKDSSLKTSAYIIEELLKQHQIILIQEHWLFKAQINTIGDLNKNINFVGKGVDMYLSFSLRTSWNMSYLSCCWRHVSPKKG